MANGMTGGMTDRWAAYLAPSAADTVFSEVLRLGRPTFGRLRATILRVVERLKAETVACLGAGALNDIPFAELVRSGAVVHLVDWVPQLVEFGVDHAIIQPGAHGKAPACAFCGLEPERARAYCRAFRPSPRPQADVCAHFRPLSGPNPRCAAYQPGLEPHVHCQDVTAGYASGFADQMAPLFADLESWRQALRRALDLARKPHRPPVPLAIADTSVDLVISSMLVSQFEHEPYGYFSKRVAELLGPPQAREEKRLASQLDRLRSTLLLAALERHCDEIARILTPTGACFMCFETFHYDPRQDRQPGHWFLVREMHQAIDVLSRHFRFDFDLLAAKDYMIRYQPGTRKSIVSCFVLRPSGRQNVAPASS